MTFSCRTAPWPGRLFSTSAQPISNRRYAKKIRGPGPSSLGIYEPQRGSVPKPNVVPRLRDYVGLRANTTQPQRGCGYIGARVDHHWSFGFTRMKSNGAIGRNPVGVDISFVPSTQGRRCAPTLGSVSERRWRSAVDFSPRRGRHCVRPRMQEGARAIGR